jgi:hypothetical protein
MRPSSGRSARTRGGPGTVWDRRRRSGRRSSPWRLNRVGERLRLLARFEERSTAGESGASLLSLDAHRVNVSIQLQSSNGCYRRAAY